jgi:3-hydroxyacyl-[acyl-carrier-protein] dehydratase
VAEHRVRTHIAASHPSLAGHFPGNPIVPGVVLLEAVAHALREAVGAGARVTALPSVKFVRPVRPEQAVEIVVRTEAPAGSTTASAVAGARFEILAANEVVASGRMDYVLD